MHFVVYVATKRFSGCEGVDCERNVGMSLKPMDNHIFALCVSEYHF